MTIRDYKQLADLNSMLNYAYVLRMNETAWLMGTIARPDDLGGLSRYSSKELIIDWIATDDQQVRNIFYRYIGRY